MGTYYRLRIPDLNINNRLLMSEPDLEKTLYALFKKHHFPSQYLRLLYNEEQGYLLIQIKPNGPIIMDIHYDPNPYYVIDMMKKRKKYEWIYFSLDFYHKNMQRVIDRILKKYEEAVYEFLETIPDIVEQSTPSDITNITAIWGRNTVFSVPYNTNKKKESVYALMLKIADKALNRPTRSFNYAIDFGSPLITNWKLNRNGKGTLDTYTLLRALRERLGTNLTENVYRRTIRG